MYLIRSKKLDLSSRKELKIEPGGGERLGKINRPISLGKEGLPKREVLKD